MMKTKKIMATFLAVTMLASLMPTAALTVFAEDVTTSVVIPLDENGIPNGDSGDGWRYAYANEKDESKTLILENGYSFTLSGECNVEVDNYGIIEGGTYNSYVDNYNVINGGLFNDYLNSRISAKINDAEFPLTFELNDGTWNSDYTAPKTYSYKNGLTLPTAENLSMDGYLFGCWHDDAAFFSEPVTAIPSQTKNKLTFYARFLKEPSTWEKLGEQAESPVDYSTDTDGNYTVYTAKGLAKIANIVNGGDNLAEKTVTLANDIDLLDGGVFDYGENTAIPSNSWIPINNFWGTFDGNGKKISHLYIATTSAYGGLFGANYGTIKNLEIASGKITMHISSNKAYRAGGICATTAGTVKNCINRASISSKGGSTEKDVALGGIVGSTGTATYGAATVKTENCINYGTISAGGGATTAGISGGGIVGLLASGMNSYKRVLVNHCANHGTVTIATSSFGEWAGGIAGKVKGNGTNSSSPYIHITNCENTAQTSGRIAGGIAALNSSSSIIGVFNNFNSGNVTAGRYAGGILGSNSAPTAVSENCYNTGTVQGNENSGGIVGNISSGTVKNCYFKQGTAEDTYGGTKGKNVTIENCVAFTTEDGTHTLADSVYETTDLLTALKAWVSSQNSNNYLSWVADEQNDNYPKFLVKTKVTMDVSKVTASSITISFDPSLQSLTAENFSVTDESSAPVTVTVTSSADNSSYILSGTFTAGQTYTVTANVISITHEIENNSLSITIPTPTTGGSAIKYYTVQFDTDGGSKVKTQTVKKGLTLSEPTAPTKEGYLFAGWYTDKEYTAAYDFSSAVTKGFTLYAKWVEDEIGEPSDDKNDDKPQPTPSEWSNPFTDVEESDWFFDVVKYANENGLMSGTASNTFAPNETVTRGMFVTVLYRLEGEPSVDRFVPFADVRAYMYCTNAINWARRNGIVNGISETEFAPDDAVTREQTAAILYRYAQYKGYDVSVGEDTNILSYTDFDEISEYAISAVQYAVGSGLMKGKTETSLNPRDFATRAELAAILSRLPKSNK